MALVLCSCNGYEFFLIFFFILDARSMQSNMNPGNRPIQQPINPSIPPNPGGMPPPAASAPLLQQPQPNNGIGISQSQDWRTGPPEQDWRASTGDWRMNDDEWRAGRDDWRADPSLYYGVNGPPNGPPRGGGSYRGQRPRFDGPSHVRLSIMNIQCYRDHEFNLDRKSIFKELVYSIRIACIFLGSSACM